MSNSGGIPELQYNHPDGRQRTRLEMDQWLRQEIPKVHWLRIIASKNPFNLPKQISWDMREIVLKHWLLDEMVRRQFIVGDQLGVNQTNSNDEGELRQFTQRLAYMVQAGHAVSPQHAEGVDMSQFQPPPPPMMGAPNGQPQPPQQMAYPPGPPQPPGPPGPPQGYAQPPMPPGPPGPPAGPPQGYAQPPQPPGPPQPPQGYPQQMQPPPGPPGYAPPPPGVPAGPPMGPPPGVPAGPPQGAAPAAGGRGGRKKADAAPPPPGPMGPPGAPQGFAPAPPFPGGPQVPNGAPPQAQGGFAPLPPNGAPAQQSFAMPPPQAPVQQQAAPAAPVADPRIDQVLSLLAQQQKENAELKKQMVILSTLVTVLGRGMYQKQGSADPAAFLVELGIPVPQ